MKTAFLALALTCSGYGGCTGLTKEVKHTVSLSDGRVFEFCAFYAELHHQRCIKLSSSTGNLEVCEVERIEIEPFTPEAPNQR